MMAALRRLFQGAEVERVRPQPEPEPPPPPLPPPPPPPPPPWGMEARRCPVHGFGGGERLARGAPSGSQEQPPYPEYGSHYWNSQPRASYPSSYPIGRELQGQVSDPSYTNGVYGTPYGTGPPCPAPPQSNAYYSSGHPPAPYSTESPSVYRSRSPAAKWNYPPPDCPAEGSMVRRQVPAYSPSQTPGFPPYPYGDSNHGVPQQGPPPPPPPRLQNPTWRPQGVYGMQPSYGWSPASTGHGSRYVAESPPPWPANGVAAPHVPNSNAAKDCYNQPEQETNQHRYLPEASHQPPGTMNDCKPAQLDVKPSTSIPKVQYCAQPQLYDNVRRKPPVTGAHGQDSKTNGQPSLESSEKQLGTEKVMQIMEGFAEFEEEVDEFVGKKTDKAYRQLEEILTKKLLELDSIETGGQDHVRQARKEAVNRIQAVLEELERKGL